jgi:hypothetical protein
MNDVFKMMSCQPTLRNWALNRIGIYDIMICSMGGCASTYFMKALFQAGFKVNTGGAPSLRGYPARDFLKHSIEPPDESNLPSVCPAFRGGANKFIYIYANPSRSVRSVFRRGQQHWHYLNVNQINHKEIESAKKIQALRSIEEYIRNGKDIFNIEKQFDNWMKAKLGKPVLFLKFPFFFEEKEAIYQFLETKKDFLRFRKPNVLETNEVTDPQGRVWFTDDIPFYQGLNEKVKSMETITIRRN